MSDYISRQAAIDVVMKCYFNDDLFEAYEYELNELPPIQPEIIRCKDCKHRYVDGDNVRFNVCELNHNKVQSDDWYCADAERRTDE